MFTALLPTAGSLTNEAGRRRLSGALKSDFQATDSFRDYLCDMMNRFIVMGAGGAISGGYSVSFDNSGNYDVIQEAITIAEEGGYLGVESWPAASDQPTEADRERWKKEAEAYHQAIRQDQNLLYRVTRDGETLYTNMDEFRYHTSQQFYRFDNDNRPAGYNTVLTFDGQKCAVTVAGQEFKLYGEDGKDRYTDDGSQWYLPGYVNFPAGADSQQVTVFLAVADVPALYLTPNYASDQWGQWPYNRLYYLEKDWQENRQQLVVKGAIQFGVGLLFLGVWFLLRREKPLADRAIARCTGHIWFEFKLLLLLLATVFSLFPFTEDARWLLQEFREVAYAEAFAEVGYQVSWFVSSYLYEVFRRPAALLAAFWALYLFVNDLRYGDRPWRHGICGMLTARSLQLPIQKQMSRLTGMMVLTALSLCAVTMNLLVYYLSFGSLRLDVVWLFLLLPCLLLFAVFLYSVRLRRLWGDLGALTEQIRAIRDGSLTDSLPLPEDSDLRRSMEELSDIQQGMARAVEEQTRSERMKVELVTNVSHDLKTPLTSIISYAELLKQEELEPPAGEYVDILCQKAERLRSMVLDVFEVSKAASGQLPVNLERLDLKKLLCQTLADMEQSISAAPILLRTSLPEDGVDIIADGDRLYRVFQNLLQNALQYSLEGSRVYLSLSVAEGQAVVSLKNTSKTELPDGVDFTARFVRGDESRSDGGSGLGLAIAQSFTAACGGQLTVAPVADLFVVSASFPLAEP